MATYQTAVVELEIDGKQKEFEVTHDGTIYYRQFRSTYPKNEYDVLQAAKTGRIVKKQLRKVNNPQLQKLVFAKYLEDLQLREEQRETETVDNDTDEN